MPIEIKIYTVLDATPERQQIEESLAAIGFIPRTYVVHTSTIRMPIDPEKQLADSLTGADTQSAKTLTADYGVSFSGDAEVQSGGTSHRQRGQPSPGKARRTKAEIAEDEAAETADTSRETEVVHAISSGGERISPDDEQDAADEAREAAANKTGDALTHEDLRKALAAYSKKHGMKAAVAAVKKDGIIGCTVDQVPVERIADVISSLHDARKAEEPATEREEAPAMPTYPATKDGLMKAMLDYALKYDGTNDIKQASMTTMPATMTDAPAIFKLRFGEAVNALSKVPEDGYAQAIADVQEATVKNPFNREVK